jgi:hypothetical protein
MGAVFELDISAAGKLVLLAMADHARDDGTGCYPSVETLARKTSQSRRGVQKIIRRLEYDGLLRPTANVRGGRNLATEYQITLEKGEQSSLFSGPKGRTGMPERANLGAERANGSAQKGEPGSPQPLRNKNEPPRNTVSPAGVQVSTWMEFLELRKKIGRPLTAGAVDLALRELATLAAEGDDPQRIVEQSIARSWSWLYGLPKNGSKGGLSRAEERTRNNLRAAGFGG